MRKLLFGAALALASLALFQAFAGSPSIPIRLTAAERGELGAAAVTGTTANSANTVVTATKQSTIVAFDNTTNAEVMITLGGANFKRMPSASFRVFDLRTNEIAFPPNTVWGVYYTGSAPTSGNVEVISFPLR